MVSPADLTSGIDAVRAFDAVVIGASAGAIEALKLILPKLPVGTRFATLIVVHVAARRHSLLAEIFSTKCSVPVLEAHAHQHADRGTITFAPSDYHLLVERGGTLSLSIEPPVQFSRPSIDVLFESAARAYGRRLCAVVLTSASTDGVHGAEAVQRAGGMVIVQDPNTAEATMLPRSTLEALTPDAVLSPAEIGMYLRRAALVGDA